MAFEWWVPLLDGAGREKGMRDRNRLDAAGAGRVVIFSFCCDVLLSFVGLENENENVRR